MIPEAKDRTVPILRAHLERAQRATYSYRRAETAIERIEKAASATTAGKR